MGDSSPWGLVQHWDGQTWTDVATEQPRKASAAGFNGVAAISPDDVWVVGEYYAGGIDDHVLIEHWDGQSFSIVPVVNFHRRADRTIKAIAAVSAHNIWAVGGSNWCGIILHWNGRTWRRVEKIRNGYFTEFSGVSIASRRSIWAVGFHVSSPSGPQVPIVERWDGQEWRPVQTPDLHTEYAYLKGVDAISPTDIWAVGHTGDIVDQRSLAEHWDGRSWSVIDINHPGSTMDYLTSVAGSATDDVWAVGATQSGARTSTLIEHWGGQGWSLADSPNPIRASAQTTNALSSVAVNSADDAWSVGYASDPPSDASDPLHLHWDGSNWSLAD